MPIKDPLGFPYHRDLDSLKASALYCTLCDVVQSGVKMWFDDYRDAESNPSFKHFKECSPLPQMTKDFG